MTRRLLLLSCMLFVLSAGVAFADTFAFLTTRTGGDTIDWGQLGGVGATFASPANWTSTLGATGTASDAGTFERRDEGNGWDGIFSPGDRLLWNQDNGQPITIHFDTAISLGGAQIQDDFFGAFQGCVQAQGSFGLSPVFCTAGNNTGGGTDTAPFVGIQDLDGGNITDLIFTTHDGNTNPTALNRVTFEAGVPEPASILLLVTMVAGIGGLKLRQRRR